MINQLIKVIPTFCLDFQVFISNAYLLFVFIIHQLNGNLTVDGIDFYVTDAFGEELFNSCKDVKFGTMNTRAIEFIGAGAKNFKGNN